MRSTPSSTGTAGSHSGWREMPEALEKGDSHVHVRPMARNAQREHLPMFMGMARNTIEEDLARFAYERGFAVQDVDVAIDEGRTRPGWLVYDFECESFFAEALNWTTAQEVEEYIRDSS
jgi:hypothetical protein